MTREQFLRALALYGDNDWKNITFIAPAFSNPIYLTNLKPEEEVKFVNDTISIEGGGTEHLTGFLILQNIPPSFNNEVGEPIKQLIFVSVEDIVKVGFNKEEMPSSGN